MRYLRDSTFLSWTAIVAILGGILLFSVGLAEGKPTAFPPGVDRGSVVSVTESDSAATVDQLRGLAPYGIAAGDNAKTLAAWATQVNEVAESGAAVRASEGATETDTLYSGFNAIAGKAAALAGGKNNVVAARSLRTAILLGIDRVGSITAGLPVPPVVDGLTGSGSSGTDVEVPPVPDPASLPPLPKPAPGAGHNHSAPSVPDAPSVPAVPVPEGSLR